MTTINHPQGRMNGQSEHQIVRWITLPCRSPPINYMAHAPVDILRREHVNKGVLCQSIRHVIPPYGLFRMEKNYSTLIFHMF